MERLHTLHQCKVVVDSAFESRKNNFLIMSSQDDPQLLAGATPREEARAIVVSNRATSVRQLSEHGMQMIQGEFPWLKVLAELTPLKALTLAWMCAIFGVPNCQQSEHQ